jgi:hypothetical protein
MSIQMQGGASPDELKFARWNDAIVGDAVDLRGSAAIEFAKRNSNAIHTFRYDPNKLAIEFDGKMFSAEEPETAFADIANSSALLETTTLGFTEILLCCRALKQSHRRAVSLLYTEPQNYYRPRRTQIVHRRDFDLSEEVEEFTGVPGNTVLLLPERPAKVVIFVGFEGQRLNRFLEQTEISPSKCAFVFGVPAFHPGWEMDAFANNLRVLKGEKMASRVHFCGAQNPRSAYETLVRIYASCNGEKLSVVPIGTKPHGLGSALFLCEHSDVGVDYDNPKRRQNRSDKVGAWHLFDAEF